MELRATFNEKTVSLPVSAELEKKLRKAYVEDFVFHMRAKDGIPWAKPKKELSGELLETLKDWRLEEIAEWLVSLLPEEDVKEIIKENREQKGYDVPEFPPGANIPDIPEDGFKAKDLDGVEWIYNAEEDEWKQVKNSWMEGDKVMVLMRGECECCGDYIEFLQGTQEVCANCE